MTAKHKHDYPILVTGAAGAVGGIGRNLTEFLLARGQKVRAMVRREDERAEALRRLGAQVVEGDLTDLASMHRAIEGCRRLYFGMSVSPAYLEATVNTAAVARHHGVEAFVNMSQMTVTQMSIAETTDSPQHKLHWLAEQALSWSGLPVVTVRPTVFMEASFSNSPLPAWSESLRQARFPEHLVRHLSALAELTRRGRYDRMTDTMRELTGEAPTNMRDFVKRHTAEFTQNGQHASSLL